MSIKLWQRILIWAAILAVPIEAELEALGLKRHLSANRTQGVPNMIALVRDTAARIAAG